MFQNKDKEVGGTGKASSSAATASSNNNNPNSPASIKDNLLKWCQLKTQGYQVNKKMNKIFNRICNLIIN
jgi:hypothetical protein